MRSGTQGQTVSDRRAIVLLNKTDLEMRVEKEELEPQETGCTVIPVSAKEEQGIEELEQEIKRMF